ncbi:MAG: patatin-like phospholipase family protein, partial [Alphaproteobacteria bacterium]|nr:patatin-like phospholipase family protein [Alphaproteobacteria bacterium]
VAGTSIGAIVGGAIAHDSLDLDSMLKVLETEGSKIFSNTLLKRMSSLCGATDEIYDKTYLVKRLGEIHGANTRLADLKKDLIVISHNSTRQTTEFFSTFEAKTGVNNKKVAKAVCASASAPVYFQAEQDEDTKDMLIDGGLDANNPTMAAFGVLAKYDGAIALKYNYISVGTGRPNTKRKFDPDLGAVDYVPQLMDLCMDGNSQCTSKIAKNIFGKRTVRLNIILPEKIEMDKTDSKNFKKLSNAFDEFMKQEKNQIRIKRAAQMLYDGAKEE